MTGLTVKGLQFLNLGPFALSVEPGEAVGISGPSGSGKTLFLRAVCDLEPHEGNVSLDGVEARAMMPREWRRKVGLLPAESLWWYETVGDHFLEIEETLLGKLGFDGKVLDWEVSRLSTGERQRLSLARCLSRSPQALLLDEPTANLDPANIRRVESLIEAYRIEKKAPVLWVGHDPEQRIRVAGRQFELVEGKLKGLA